MGKGYFKSATGLLKIFEQILNILVFALVLAIHYDTTPIESKRTRALLASSIIGFILTLVVIVGRFVGLDKKAPLGLIEMGVGICMAIFNVVTGALCLEEAVDLNDYLNLFPALNNYLPTDTYLAAGSFGVIVGAVYLLDAVLSLMGFLKKK